jgi:hypothetical protein
MVWLVVRAVVHVLSSMVIDVASASRRRASAAARKVTVAVAPMADRAPPPLAVAEEVGRGM